MNAEHQTMAAELGLDGSDVRHHVDHYMEHGEAELDRKVRVWWLPNNPRRQAYRRLMRELAAERRAA